MTRYGNCLSEKDINRFIKKENNLYCIRYCDWHWIYYIVEFKPTSLIGSMVNGLTVREYKEDPLPDNGSSNLRICNEYSENISIDIGLVGRNITEAQVRAYTAMDYKEGLAICAKKIKEYNYYKKVKGFWGDSDLYGIHGVENTQYDDSLVIASILEELCNE